jgi:hypothetical protein
MLPLDHPAQLRPMNSVWVETVSGINLQENNNYSKNLDVQEINNEYLSKHKIMLYPQKKATLIKQ